MDVIIDDQPNTDLAPGAPEETFGAAFGRIVETLRRAGRTVTSVRIDGQPLDDETAERLRERAVSEVRQLNVTTADVDQVAADLLTEITQGLRRLKTAGRRLADQFQSGDTQEALQGVPEVLEAWQLLTEGLQQVARLRSVDLMELKVGGQPATERLQALLEATRDLAGAFKSQDYVAVGDAFGYDLPDQVQFLQDLAQGLER